MSALPAPSATGVRTIGDHYQWLHAWGSCLRTLRLRPSHGDEVVRVGVEVAGAGNLDDIVEYRAASPHRHYQVKYAADARVGVGTAYLTRPGRLASPPLLRQLADAWRSLRVEHPDTEVVLSTNRLVDHADPLMQCLDGRTGLLLPRAAQGGPTSQRGRQRAEWASAAGCTETELLQMLATLRIEAGQDVEQVIERLEFQMQSLGLRSDGTSVRAGADWVAEQVRRGHRTLDSCDVRQAVRELGLQAALPFAVVSIAIIAEDRLAHDADLRLDWVDRMAGHTPWQRRRPAPPATWSDLQTDLQNLAQSLPAGTPVLVSGALRQATGFMLGAALRMVTGNEVAIRQRAQLWSSLETPDPTVSAGTEVVHIGTGEDVAVVVEVATRISDDVIAYVRDQQLPVGQMLILRPTAGVHDRSLCDSTSANAFAFATREAVRRHSRTAPRLHLFLGGPLGLALLLCHRWNRVRPTVVYEDVNDAPTYEAAFDVDA